MKRTACLLGTLIALTQGVASAQWDIPVVLEAHVGYAMPGEGFAADQGGVRAQAGPRVSIGARLQAFDFLAFYGNYNQVHFGCSTCSFLGIDPRIVTRGVEGGADLRPLGNIRGLTPWIRAAAIYQSLEFSEPGDRMTSESDVGYSASSGVAITFRRRLEVMPGIRFLKVPATFDFAELPDRKLDVSAISLELGLALRFGALGE